MTKKPIDLGEDELAFLYSIGAGLKEGTLLIYLTYFRLMKKYLVSRELDQRFVDYFLNKHRSSAARAFLKNYLSYVGSTLVIQKKKGTAPRKRVEIIPPERMKKILAKLGESGNHGSVLATELAYECALRLSEVVGIRKQDFNVDKFREEITTSGKKYPCELWVHGKGAIDRRTLVPFELFVRLFEFMEDKRGSDKIFKFGAHRLWERLNEVCKALGYVQAENPQKALYHPHTLRHTKATEWLVNENENINTIKELLGHSSISTTQIYLNPDVQKILTNRKEKMIAD